MARFPDTHWSLIERTLHSPSVRNASFAELARDYQPAIVAFFRARLPASDADDAAQSFLSLSFEHAWWGRADAANGSFRSFLLMLLHRHIGHVRDRRRVTTEPLEAAGEVRDDGPGPEQSFDTRFALLLTQRALERLRVRYRARGREAVFDVVARVIADPPGHGEVKRVADRIGMAPNTLAVETKRLRVRLHDALRDELRELCADAASFESEWRNLQCVLGRG